MHTLIHWNVIINPPIHVCFCVFSTVLSLVGCITAMFHGGETSWQEFMHPLFTWQRSPSLFWCTWDVTGLYHMTETHSAPTQEDRLYLTEVLCDGLKYEMPKRRILVSWNINTEGWRCWHKSIFVGPFLAQCNIFQPGCLISSYEVRRKRVT